MFCGECGRSVTITRPPLRSTLADLLPADVELPPELAMQTEIDLDEVVEIEESGPEHVAGEEPVSAEEEPESAEEEPELAEEPAIAEAPDPIHLDVEETRITSGIALGDRFVLQFSTGESVTVFGTGILGRNPVAEPGEYFDHFVPIVDPSKSVSKTHLEFGQTAGAFWISDRYSGNGTGYRPPEGVRTRCEPGKRYLVTRGSRVDIGEQFFIVS